MGSVRGAIDVLENVIAPLERHRPSCPGTGRSSTTARRSTRPSTTCGSSSTSPNAARAAGISPLHAARDTDLGRYTDWPDAERIVGNLHRAYAELDGAERGAPIDVMAALADMVTYNGGRPLTCLA